MTAGGTLEILGTSSSTARDKIRNMYSRTFSGSNTDDSLAKAVSNSFLSLLEKIHSYIFGVI